MAKTGNSKKDNVCPNCGAFNDSNNHYCIYCGSEIFHKVCPKCGGLIKSNSVICSTCGHKLANDNKNIKCPKCGYDNDNQFRFCTNCGSKLNKSNVENSTVRCPKCFSRIPYDSKFCTVCGSDLTKESDILFENGTYNLYKGNKKLGEFKTEESATVARSTLKKIFWSVEYFSSNNIKNIIKIDHLYYIFGYENGMIVDCGIAENYVYAKRRLDDFKIKHQNGFDGNNNSNEIKIKMESNKFIVYKDSRRYGSYDNKMIANKVMNLLNNNNENVDYFKDNNIFNVDGKYCVLILENSKISYKGEFSSRYEAQRYLNRNKDSSNDINIISTINHHIVRNESLIFGSFLNIDVANIVKRILEEKNSDILFFKDHNIFKINENKHIVLVLDGSIISYKGEFSSRDEAQKFLDDYYKEDIINIKQKNQEFILYKESYILGSFYDKIIANRIKDILEKNNGDISYFKNNNIIEIDKKFCVFVIENSTIKYKGSFFSKTEAMKFLDKLNNNETNTSSTRGIVDADDTSSIGDESVRADEIGTQDEDENQTKSKGIDEYKESEDVSNKNKEYINQTDGSFIVHNKGVVFGHFKSRELAVIVSDKLIEHNWNKAFFKDYNVFLINKNSHVFILEDDYIVWKGTYKSLKEAQKVANEIKN